MLGPYELIIYPKISGVRGAKACFTFTAGSLWPKKMVQQLLEKLIESGLLVHAHTRVDKVSPQRDVEGYWSIQTSRGSLRARKIVFCTNAYTPALLPRYRNKIVPVRGICSQITSPKGRDSPHLPNTYSLRFDDQQYDYLIPRVDGSIIVGGARKAFWHIKDSWFGNINDNELVQGGDEYFESYMQNYFKGWEDSGAKLAKIWTGIMGYSSDFVPHLGQVPNKPGQFIIAGFSGHGMPQILLAAQGIAKMVTENISYEETGLPRVFETTNKRLDSQKNELEEGYQNLWQPTSQPKL
jgi:glycine/D-amino acid oxidase-like deaminating enzyme